MTNPWARPEHEPPSRVVGGPVFDIPLSGDPVPGDTSPPSDPPGRIRRVVGFSALAGVALGIVAATVIIATSADDDPEVTGDTTVTVPDDPSQLTTPPTLPPALPPTLPPIAELEATQPAPPTIGPDPTTPLGGFPVETTLPPPTLPEFSPAAESDSNAGAYDLLAAAAALEGSAWHTVANVATSDGRFTISITDNLGEARDHILADYDVETAGVDQIELVTDPATGLGYQRGRPDSPDMWELWTAEELLLDSGVAELGDVARRLAAPLVTPSTLASAVSIEDLGLVRLDRRAGSAFGEITRRYRIVFDPADVAGQSLIMVIFEDTITSAGTIEVDAYVTPDGRLALTTAAAGDGSNSAVISLVVEAVLAPVPFPLPPPELIIDEQ